jgi:adenylate kinase
MRLIIFGPPGVGKGTQAQILSQEYHIPHISTGDILREAIREGTELGKRAQSYSSQGELVPDEIMVGIVHDVLSSERCRNGFILDGFPRTVAQAKALSELFKELNITLNRVVNIEADESKLILRLAQRRQCRHCGSVFNLMIDKLDGSNCPVCHGVGTIYQRDDDKEETIKHRLKVYNESTLPVKAFYRAIGLLTDINGDGEIEAIHQSILDALRSP